MALARFPLLVKIATEQRLATVSDRHARANRLRATLYMYVDPNKFWFQTGKLNLICIGLAQDNLKQ